MSIFIILLVFVIVWNFILLPKRRGENVYRNTRPVRRNVNRGNQAMLSEDDLQTDMFKGEAFQGETYQGENIRSSSQNDEAKRTTEHYSNQGETARRASFHSQKGKKAEEGDQHFSRHNGDDTHNEASHVYDWDPSQYDTFLDEDDKTKDLWYRGK